MAYHGVLVRVKQDKEAGSTPTLHSHKKLPRGFGMHGFVRPLGHRLFGCVRRQQSGSALVPCGARPWYMVLVAQQELRRASLYVGPSMRGIGRMCLDSVGMHDI